MKYGLTEKQINEIRDILASYPQVEQAILFGSRAIDTFKEASDVDIAILGDKCDLLLSAKIKDHLEDETYLPFFFDIIAYNTIKSPELKTHIQTKGKVIFQRKEEWREVRLGDFAEINPSEKMSKGTVAKKIAMEDIHPFTKKAVSFSLEEYKGGVKFRNGDTIMARITPSLENGKTSYIDILEDDETGFGSTEFIVFRERENISDKSFMYYLSISQIIREIAIKSMTGSSGRQRVQTDVLRELIFDAPPLPEQKAIAEVLSSLDDKIDLLHRQNKTLEEMAETLFRQWFIEERDESWEEKSLGELIEIGSGKGLKKEKFYTNGKYPVLGANGIIGKTNEFLFNEKLIFTGRVGTLGNIFRINKKKVWLSDNTLVIKPKDNYNFIYFTLKNAKLGELNVGSTQPLIRQSDLKVIQVSISNEKKHIEFEETTDFLFGKIDFNKSQIHSLVNLRDSLLPKLMSGEVRIKMK